MIKLLYRCAPVLLLLFACSNNPDLTDPVNIPPPVPSLDAAASPPHGSTAQPVTPTLRWVCNDPDSDPLVFDLYFGSINPPPLIAGDYPLTNYKPDTLNAGTTYYWRVVAKDPVHGHSVSSPVWNFTTETSTIPALQVEPTDLDFNTALTSIGFVISNRGGGTLTWSLSESIPWLTLSATSGTAQTEQDNITASVNRNGLAVGVYDGEIIVSSNGGSTVVTVSIEVSANPTIAISADSIDIGTTGAQARFQINNSGNGTLRWTVSADQPYASITPTTGTTTTETDTVRITIDRTGLAVGDHLVLVTVTPEDGESRIVKIAFSVPGIPVLRIVPDSLGYGDNLNQLAFEISNSGTGVLTWSVTDNRSWLSVSPINGTSGLESDTVQVNVDRTGLTPGIYVGTVSVTSNGGTALVKVTAEVRQLPQLQINVDSVYFAGDETQKTIRISNTGGETLTWSVTSTQSWLSANPTSGSATSDIDNVTLTVNRADLAIGTHSALLIVSSNAGNDTVAVTVVVAAQPTLLVSADTLSYGIDDTQQSFTIRNTGTGTLSWGLQRDVTWLSASVTSGTTATETDQITVTVDRAPLAPGEHVGRVFVTSNGGTDTVYIKASKAVQPILDVSVDTLDFTENDTENSFVISNTGTGTLTWNVTENTSWLSVSPSSGQANGEDDLVTVTVNPNSLGPGTHVATLTVSSNGGTDFIVARISINEEPTLLVTPDTLNFGANLSTLKFRIANSGTGTLTWSISETSPWLGLSSSSGAATTEDDSVTVTVNRTGLPPADYVTAISVNSNGGTENIVILMNVPAQPVLTVLGQNLDFGSGSTDLNFRIRNTGTGTLTWSATDNQSWLTVAPASGATQTETDTVAVEVDRTGLGPGSYSGIIEVTSNGGVDTVTVAMSIAAVPVLQVSTTSLNFGTDQVLQSVDITNSGNGTLTWSIGSNRPWLSAIPDAGSTTTETDAIQISVDRGQLTPGTYLGALTVNSNGGTTQIQIQVTVLEAPVLSVSPQSLAFATALVTLPISITNSGGQQLNWTANESITWLSLDATSGNSTGETDNINASVDRTGLTPGDYPGSIIITSNGGEDTVDVTMTVQAEPELGVSLDTLNFGTDQTSLNFTIANTGTGDLNWTITDPETWLQSSPDQGQTQGTPDQVTVTVDRTGLAPGDYEATLSVSSDGGSDVVVVLMTVTESATLGVSTSSLSFGDVTTELSVIIQNTGGGALDWSISHDQLWLATSTLLGSTTSEEDTVVITVVRLGLVPQEYHDTLRITSNGGAIDIPVTMTVPNPPLIGVSVDTISFGEFITEGHFTIFNTGNGGLTWSVVANQDWLTAAPTNGTVSNEEDTVTISVSRDQLSPGSYFGSIAVNSNAGQDTVVCQIIVPVPPSLSVNVDSLDFGTDLQQLSMDILNIGSGLLTWQCDTSENWLSASPDTGSTTGETDSVSVRVRRNQLRNGSGNGTYGGIVTVFSNGGTHQVKVAVTITDADADGLTSQ